MHSTIPRRLLHAPQAHCHQHSQSTSILQSPPSGFTTYTALAHYFSQYLLVILVHAVVREEGRYHVNEVCPCGYVRLTVRDNVTRKSGDDGQEAIVLPLCSWKIYGIWIGKVEGTTEIPRKHWPTNEPICGLLGWRCRYLRQKNSE